MKLYSVHKQGVYRQECGGVFSKYQLAVDAAIAIAEGDRDTYHHYQVIEHDLDVLTSQNSRGDLWESPVLFQTRKGHDGLNTVFCTEYGKPCENPEVSQRLAEILADTNDKGAE